MKNSKIVFAAIIAISAVLVVLLSNLGAQSSHDAAIGGRIAVCNVAEVFNNYKRAKDLTSKLDTRKDRIKAENEKRGKAIAALQVEVESLKEGSKKYEQTLNEVQRLAIERQAWLQFQDTLAVRDHHRLTKEMYDDILRTIASIAKRKSLDMVIYREGNAPATKNISELLQVIRSRKILYSNQAIDITSETLRRLNDTYSKGR